MSDRLHLQNLILSLRTTDATFNRICQLKNNTYAYNDISVIYNFKKSLYNINLKQKISLGADAFKIYDRHPTNC